MDTVETKHCLPCEGGVPPLTSQSIKELFKQLAEGWQVSGDNKRLTKDFTFKNYYQTMAFVNAIAWMAHIENHHPDLLVGYNHCQVNYSTHAIDGLSENDFICGAKVDALFEPYAEKSHARK